VSELLPSPAPGPLIGPGTSGSGAVESLGRDANLGGVLPSGDATEAMAPKWVGRKLGALFWVSVGWMVLIVVLALAADHLHLPPPNHSVGAIGETPGLHHLLGTDLNGEDMLSRVIFGARVTLIVGFFSIMFGLVVGGAIGLVAGYYRGRVESVLMSTVDCLLAFPALVFALAIVTFLGRTTLDITLTLGVLSIAPLARVVRGSTVLYSQREFVLAARTLGASGRRIVLREVLPNVVPAGVSFGIIGVAVAMVAEGALSFLGLSVSPQNPTWGGLIQAGYVGLEHHPLVSLFPAGMLFLTVLALNFAGEALRALFDIKEAGI
jgi:peptide/nickel transport system permease protein